MCDSLTPHATEGKDMSRWVAVNWAAKQIPGHGQKANHALWKGPGFLSSSRYLTQDLRPRITPAEDTGCVRLTGF